MNTTTLLSSSASPCVGGGQDGDHLNCQRPSHLVKFAFLLSSARGEGSDEPVVGFHHDVEMAACFSSRHLAGGSMHNGSMMPVTPPSISSSSLSLQGKSAGGGIQPHAVVYAGSPKKSLLDTAALNMSTPFFTTPDTVSLTAKTVLKNLGESELAHYLSFELLRISKAFFIHMSIHLQSFFSSFLSPPSFSVNSYHNGRSHGFKIALDSFTTSAQGGDFQLSDALSPP